MKESETLSLEQKKLQGIAPKIKAAFAGGTKQIKRQAISKDFWAFKSEL